MSADVSRRGLNELVADGMIGHDTATRLAAALRASGDVLICGPAGSGKTMLLRALLDESGQPGQRIAWIGPGAASGCPDTLALSDGAGSASVRSLVRSARRMGATRIVVDDVAGAEALELIDTMGGGGTAVACVISADDAVGAIRALLAHAAAAPDATRAGALELLAAAAPMIVQLHARAVGRRALMLTGEDAWSILKRGV